MEYKCPYCHKSVATIESPAHFKTKKDWQKHERRGEKLKRTHYCSAMKQKGIRKCGR